MFVCYLYENVLKTGERKRKESTIESLEILPVKLANNKKLGRRNSSLITSNMQANSLLLQKKGVNIHQPYIFGETGLLNEFILF